MVRMSPRCTGFVEVTTSPLEKRTTVGRLVKAPALPLWNTAGAPESTVNEKVLLTPPGVCMESETFAAVCAGICAFTCVGETKRRGTGWPFAIRQLSFRTVGSGIALVAKLVELRFVPSTDISPPGATGEAPSAALTTLLMNGGATRASKFG